MDDASVTALVLAGRREGAVDPLAREHGVSDKCLVPLAGKALILHVLAALERAPLIAKIIVSVNEPSALRAIAKIAALENQGKLQLVAAHSNLADSVIAAARNARFPMLVTTADNVLLTPDAIATMALQARVAHADAAVAFARKNDILNAHPYGQRRFYTFADDGYSNCNCYWIANTDALRAVEVFRSGGRFAKHPLRIVSAFGLLNLIRFRLGIGTLADAFARVSHRFGITIRPIIVTDGALAIDVDNERTYQIAARIIRRRCGASDSKG